MCGEVVLWFSFVSVARAKKAASFQGWQPRKDKAVASVCRPGVRAPCHEREHGGEALGLTRQHAEVCQGRC
jgi:hypothetical protein